jgi:hypothetical protein
LYCQYCGFLLSGKYAAASPSQSVILQQKHELNRPATERKTMIMLPNPTTASLAKMIHKYLFPLKYTWRSDGSAPVLANHGPCLEAVRDASIIGLDGEPLLPLRLD